MKKIILTTASVIVLISMSPSYAETVKLKTEIETKSNSNDNETKETLNTAKKTKNDTSKNYDEIKTTLLGKKSEDKNISFVIETRKTANGIIGHDIYDKKGASLAKITDIILDKNGAAIMVIVSESMLGTGTKASFDYSTITHFEADGDVVLPLTQEIIDNASAFSYDKEDGDESMQVMPDDGYSVNKILSGNLINQKNKSISEIDNISFKSAKMNIIIAGFDKTLGMGGKQAAIDYDDVKIIRTDSNLNLQLSKDKAMQFVNYKKQH